MDVTSTIEINKTAYKNNLTFIRSLIDESCIFSSVIKGNAYGHGIETFAPMAEEVGVDHFSVFSAYEAYRLKKVSNGKSTIMIMGVANSPEELEWAISLNIEFFVFDLDRLEKAVNIAKKLKKKAIVHIEIETGMNRTGFCVDELKDVIHFIEDNKSYLEIKGLCTHFAGAESITNYFRVKNQILSYNRILKFFTTNNINFKQKHLACSAAVINYPQTINDLVRVGIMQYGFWPSRESQMKYYTKNKINTNPLQPVISWKSYVMGTKPVAAGEYISYGTTVLAETDMKIATIPVGYAHGFSRSLSNQGKVIINGHRLDVVGLVNMNMMIVDITNVPEIKKGDEVILIGEQGDVSVSVASFGEMSNQLNYELLTRLPEDIPRKIIK
ncbi:MAG: alanine racemase [Vicingaceae bacterium]|nr:alanine racemase [Vicingaceae bacterium]